MKKIVYILLISLVTSLTFSSCTEEEIKPATHGNIGGGGGSDPL